MVLSSLTSLSLESLKNWSEDMAFALPNFCCASVPSAAGGASLWRESEVEEEELLTAREALERRGSWSVQPLLPPPLPPLLPPRSLPLSSRTHSMLLDSFWLPLYLCKNLTNQGAFLPTRITKVHILFQNKLYSSYDFKVGKLRVLRVQRSLFFVIRT